MATMPTIARTSDTASPVIASGAVPDFLVQQPDAERDSNNRVDRGDYRQNLRDTGAVLECLLIEHEAQWSEHCQPVDWPVREDMTQAVAELFRHQLDKEQPHRLTYQVEEKFRRQSRSRFTFLVPVRSVTADMPNSSAPASAKIVAIVIDNCQGLLKSRRQGKSPPSSPRPPRPRKAVIASIAVYEAVVSVVRVRPWVAACGRDGQPGQVGRFRCGTAARAAADGRLRARRRRDRDHRLVHRGRLASHAAGAARVPRQGPAPDTLIAARRLRRVDLTERLLRPVGGRIRVRRRGRRTPLHLPRP